MAHRAAPAILSLLLMCSLTGRLVAQTPNVLFIMADDLNNDMGAYGHPLAKTPHLDTLASQGLNFNRAYNQFPLCGPSRASLMTGLYPDQNGMKVLRGDFRKTVPDAVTLPQYFKNHGYHTARVGKIYHQNNPMGIGKEEFDDALSWNERYNPKGIEIDFPDIKVLGKVDGTLQWIVKDRTGTGATLSWLDADGKDANGNDRNDPKLHTDGEVATKAISLLDQFTKAKTPFFLAVGFYNPHTPYVAPKQFFDLYDPKDITIPKVPADYFSTLPKESVAKLTHKSTQNNLDPVLARDAIRGYLASISHMDSQAGRVIAALDDPNGDGDPSDSIRDNTIVVFLSDHGYHMGEHDHYQKMTLFDNAARTPMIVSAPGLRIAGTTSNALVELVDLYPTLTDLAGLPAPENVSGVSLAPLFLDATAKPRTSALTQVNNGYTIRTDQYRYTRYGKGGPENIELYDVIEDPQELDNLAHRDPAGHAVEIRELDALLDQRIADAQPAVAPPKPAKH